MTLGDLADWLNPFNIYDQGMTYEGYVPPYVRLGYWTFNGANWTDGQAGQVPIYDRSVSAVTDWSGTAVSYGGDNCVIGGIHWWKTTDSSNINYTNGTIRFWYQPHWTSPQNGGPARAKVAPPIQVGSNVQWSIYFATNQGSNLVFLTPT